MPADPSIYSLIQHPKPIDMGPTPFEQAGQMMQIKHLIDSGALNDLQRRKLTGDLDEHQQVKDLFARYAGKDVPVAELAAASPSFATTYQKSLLENKKLTGDIEKGDIERRAALAKHLRDSLAGVTDQASFDAWKADAGTLGAQVAKTAPAAFDPQWQRQHVMDADKFIAQSTPKFERVDLGGRVQMVDVNPITNPSIKGTQYDKTLTPGEVQTGTHQKDTFAESVRANRERERLARDTAARGDEQYDSERGVLVNKRTAVVRAPTGPGGQLLANTGKLTEAQGNATAFGMRAQGANDILIGLENDGTFGKLAQAKQGLGGVPVVGGALEAGANKFLSGNQQRYEQAQRDFVNAVLRKESGANINESEFTNARKQYFPQPGDGPDVIEQKRKNRETAIEALKVQAGPGAGKVPKATVTANPLTKPKDKLGGVLTANSDGSFNYGFSGTGVP